MLKLVVGAAGNRGPRDVALRSQLQEPLVAQNAQDLAIHDEQGRGNLQRELLGHKAADLSWSSVIIYLPKPAPLVLSHLLSVTAIRHGRLVGLEQARGMVAHLVLLARIE